MNDDKPKMPKAPPLVSKIDLYIKNNLNVLLIGPHGVGKTFDLMDAAKRHNLSMKYFSCSTMDPYTDLVGIPYPNEERNNLTMIRPRSIDDADIIFFDELNRAPDMKTLDAILEVVQFKTVNGEPLKARAVWASINPVDDDGTYNVKELDPALVDRFDIYEEIKPMISLAYFNSMYDVKISKAIKDWWDEHHGSGKADYISPRRMEKIAALFTATLDSSIVEKMMPPGGSYDYGKLRDMLDVAVGQKTADQANFGGPDQTISYDPDWLSKNQTAVLKAWAKRPPTQDTSRKVLDALAKDVGAERLVNDFGKIIDALPAAMIEGWFGKMNPSKRSIIRSTLRQKQSGLANFKKVAGV